MRIAVCDDENEWINLIEAHIKEFAKVCKDVSYDVFNSGEELIGYLERQNAGYDVIIIDIEMNGMSGIEAAQKIRDKDSSVIIFFLTSHREYVFDCFRPSPMNFWLKPVSYELFLEDMKRANERISESSECIHVTENRSNVRIRCADILYIENRERKSWIHTTNGVYKVNKLLSEFERELDGRVFVRVYKSYIINLAHLHILGSSDVTLYGSDERIPVSRTYKARLHDSYIKYMERELF